MKDSLLLGVSRHLVPMPRAAWQRHVSDSAAHTKSRLGFMSREHHLIRNFAVRELPRVGRPLTPGFIAQELCMSVEQVVLILDELEKNLTFLFRDRDGAVTWAYPVTVDATPHHVSLSTGEQVYAA